MTLNEVENYFGSKANFKKITGMANSCFPTWRKRGYVPLQTQIYLEQVTEGKLKVRADDVPAKLWQPKNAANRT